MIRQFLLIGLTLLLIHCLSEAQVPPLINYQGHLQTASDSIQTDPVHITFSIYNTRTGGTPLWAELHAVGVQDGLFHVLLGSLVTFPDTLFSEANRFLGIRVQGEEEFLPRQQIVSVAYAIRAATAASVEGTITPDAIRLTDGKASLDSLGALTASQVHTDSLNVGGKGVIDQDGNWTGQPIVAQTIGMVLDTLIVQNFQDTLDFASINFRDIDGSNNGLTAFVNLKRPSLLDIQLHLTATTSGTLFQTRLAVEPINPGGPLQTNIGNTAASLPSSGSGTFVVSNAGSVSLEPGLYRIFVQGRIEGASTLQTGILTIRVFSR